MLYVVGNPAAEVQDEVVVCGVTLCIEQLQREISFSVCKQMFIKMNIQGCVVTYYVRFQKRVDQF